MLKLNEVNPLAVFGMRRLEHCPPHFVIVKFDIYTSEKVITDWIWENLDGRFFIGDQDISENGQETVSMQKMVGFEIAGEASYFGLILDTINKREDW